MDKIEVVMEVQENRIKEVKSNQEKYKELEHKYNIVDVYYYDKMTEEEKEKVDVVIELTRTMYASKLYTIIKNRPELDDRELALICDKGNLCFGFSAGVDTITIYTD